LSDLRSTPLVASASVPVPAPFAFVDQSMHGDVPSFVRFAPALKTGFLAVPPTIGASISKLLCPPETDVAFNVFAVAHVGADTLDPDANATQLTEAAASATTVVNHTRVRRTPALFTAASIGCKRSLILKNLSPCFPHGLMGGCRHPRTACSQESVRLQ
jgi:hypothetical protein